jgi:hypothetical protein
MGEEWWGMAALHSRNFAAEKKKAIVLQRVVAWACAAVCTVHSEKGVCIMSLTA